MSRVLVVLPALDEAEAITDVIDAIPHAKLNKRGHETSVVVVDGGSKDGTVEIATNAGCHIIHQDFGGGKGIAMRLAFKHFLDASFDHLVMLDADGTYDPDDITRMVSVLEKGADVVIGSRLRGDISKGAMTRFNYVGNSILSWTAVALFGHNLSDVCSGYWAFRRNSVAQMNLNSVSFEIEAEMYAACANSGFNIKHISVRYKPRKGEAKLGSIHDGARIMRKLIIRKIFPRPIENEGF